MVTKRIYPTQKITPSRPNNDGDSLIEFYEQRIKDLEQNVTNLENYIKFCAHDLREPLRTIVGFLQLMSRHKENHQDDHFQDYLKICIRNLTRINIFASEMLINSCHHEQDQNQHKTTVVSVDIILQEVTELLCLQLLCGDISIKVAHNLPHVKGNFLHVQHIFLNIIDNIIKHSPKKPTIIYVSYKIIGKVAHFFVGEKTHDAQLYKNFFVPPSDTECQTLLKEHSFGFGIGLNLCETLIKQQKGTYQFTKDNDGTWEVTLSLPLGTTHKACDFF